MGYKSLLIQLTHIIAVGTRGNYLGNRQLILFGKFPISLVMGRDRHYCTGAVFHQYEVGNPDRDIFPRQWMPGFEPRRHPLLLHLGHIGFGNPHLVTLLQEILQLGITFCSAYCQCMLGRYRKIGSPHQCIRPGGINSDAVSARPVIWRLTGGCR